MKGERTHCTGLGRQKPLGCPFGKVFVYVRNETDWWCVRARYIECPCRVPPSPVYVIGRSDQLTLCVCGCSPAGLLCATRVRARVCVGDASKHSRSVCVVVTSIILSFVCGFGCRILFFMRNLCQCYFTRFIAVLLFGS